MEKWVLIDEPGSGRQIIRAAEVKVLSSIVSVRTPDGKSMGWQRDFYLGDAPAIPEDLSGLTKPVLEAALEAQNALAEKAGEASEIFKQEQARLAFAISELDKAADAQAREELEAQLAAWKETEYNPQAQYPVEQLDKVIRAGEELIEKEPEFASELSARIEAMKQHRAHLEAGLTFWQGEWIDLENIGKSYDDREKKLADDFYGKQLSVTLPSVAVSGIPVAVIFAPALVTVIFLIVFLLQSASKSALPKGAPGVIAMVLLLGLLGFNSYFIYGIFAGKKTVADVGVQSSPEAPALAETSLGRTIFFCSEPEILVKKQSDLQISLRQDEINTALERHLIYEGKGSEGMFDMAREKTAFQIDPRRLSIIDEITFFNRKFLMQTHIMVELSEENIEFYDFEVVLGNTKLPGLMAAHIWKQLQPQFHGMIRQLSFGKYYGIHKIEPGEIIMIMTDEPEGLIDVEAELRRIAQGTEDDGDKG